MRFADEGEKATQYGEGIGVGVVAWQTSSPLNIKAKHVHASKINQ
jgi:hypothetical protein